MSDNEIIGWHFSDPGYTISYKYERFGGNYEERKIGVGDTIEVEPTHLEMCRHGLHGSKRLLDAACYAVRHSNGVSLSRPCLSLVKLHGKCWGYTKDKYVAEKRTHMAVCTSSKETMHKWVDTKMFIPRQSTLTNLGNFFYNHSQRTITRQSTLLEAYLLEHGWWVVGKDYRDEFEQIKQTRIEKAKKIITIHST